MTRTLTFAAGLAVVIASGVVYGAWTQRWQKSADLETRAAKLRDLPDDVGRWKSQPADLEPDALAMAGAEGWWVRRFTDERTGSQPAGDPAVRPARPASASTGRRPATAPPATTWTAPPIRYTPRIDADAPGRVLDRQVQGSRRSAASELRIFWSWYGDGGWRAADNPRWDFARLPALYKLYVIRETDGRANGSTTTPRPISCAACCPGLSRTLSGP